MIVRIVRGIGAPGKLWTGDIPADGTVVDAMLIERHCLQGQGGVLDGDGDPLPPCRRTTRKLRVTPVTFSAEAIAALVIPKLFVTMGGVGTLDHGDPVIPTDLTVWNWSGRRGGHVVVNPIAVVVTRDDDPLPGVHAGYAWARTYAPAAKDEYILLDATNLARHALRVVVLEGTCPPCRESAEKAAAEATTPVGCPACGEQHHPACEVAA